jgi:catechol 2,3-dioxygenase-like lactoylglutathione lyase family enzyme
LLFVADLQVLRSDANGYTFSMKSTLQAVHPVLQARDVMESVRFYCDLGFEVLFQDSPQAPKYAAVRRDAVELHLQWADAGQWAHPVDRPAYRFLVGDVDALYREFAGSGRISAQPGQGSPWAAPADTPWGTREFHLRDPGHNSLQFYQAAQRGD